MTQWFSSGMWSDFLTWRGRLNRWPYFFRTMVLGLPVRVLFDLSYAYQEPFTPVRTLLPAAMALVFVVLLYMQLIKRCHDLDLSGWYSVVALVPILNVVAGLYFTLKRGTDGSNRFGPDPLAEGTV